YIPSERVLKVGGYEGGGAMIYYDQPTRFAPGLEQPIVDAVLKQLKKTFPPQLAPNKGQGTRPRSPEQSLKLLRTRSDMQVELVVAEPLVTSPVAVDFGPDGKIWVAEMFDYPAGTDGTYGPGGRVRVLTRSTDKQLVDTSTIFLDGIPFPTGITVWRKGVLIAAAPDILYAEDSDNDGRADIVRKLYSGFGTDNYQARVNSLEYGLDGWVYGSCGLFGGSIKSFASDQPFELGNRDFRIQPDTGAIEVATGLTQQGRVRDDFGNWFGCDNSQLGRHYPLAMHYASRNPYAPPPAGAVPLPATAADATLVPANPALQLFKLSGGSGIATAACGIGIYRDNLLGDSFQGNIFTCEPVNLLVHRLQLTPRGSSFAGTRAADELQQEFLSSTDTWFRPVQVRTAPDGSLWVLDMYRFVIEHPRWIPPESLDQIDTRAGAGMGRIYSVRPRESSSTQGISASRPAWPRLDKLKPEQLVAALDSSNGWQRDMAMQLLVWNKDSSHSQATASLKQLLRRTTRPETRVQVLATLDQLQTLSDDDVLLALQDDHAGVRRHGLRLSEAFATQGTTTSQTMLARAVELARTDSNGQVRLQAACSLGAWKNASTAAAALADIVLAAPQDAHLRSAVISSLTKENVAAFTQQLLGGPPTALAQAAPSLLPLALTMSDSDAALELLHQVAQLTERQGQVAWSWNTLAAMLGQLSKRADAMKVLPTSATYTALQNATSRARQLIQAADTTVSVRAAAMAILSRPELGFKEAPDAVSDHQILIEFLNPKHSASEQLAAANAMLRGQQPSIANDLLAAWKQMSPQLKSTVLDGLLTRDAWVAALLDALESKQVDVAELDAARRQQLLSHGDTSLKARAEKLLAGKLNPDRLAVLDSYATVTELKGDEQRGAELFRKNCSTCHRLRDTGAAVGPDLTALASKPVNFFLQEILDPNRNLDSRYMSYTALTDSGRTLTGLLAAETATAITLRGAEAKEESLQRSEIEQLSSTRASLMPEGLEKILPPQAMADVITFVKASAAEPVPPESMAVGELARDMLTESLPNETRLNLVPMAALSASDVITAMAANMPANAQEEYRRIPWIWRVAVAAGKNGDAQQLKKVIEVSLPRDGTQLRDWQAVVIGGGVINGLGLRGDWPAARINQMLEGDDRLQLKWRELIAASQRMADNQQVRTGTRYDALRIVALAPWPAPEAQLRKYIGQEVDAELQMGSVSGLADIDHPEATNLLVEYLPQFAPENRRLAIVALAHGTARQRELIKLLESGQVKPNEVAAPQRESLLLSKETDIAQSAKRLLGVQKP
ncbi:MAG: c-type cytochrome, partial [Pirellulaceae bacterium]|nr:c-type cytochrome [Pirellulaceae bacterium]